MHICKKNRTQAESKTLIANLTGGSKYSQKCFILKIIKIAIYVWKEKHEPFITT